MKYLHINIMELLQERGISKTRICKDLDLQRGNFNRYCRDEFQRLDANLLVRLCDYFNCDICLLSSCDPEKKDTDIFRCLCLCYYLLLCAAACAISVIYRCFVLIMSLIFGMGTNLYLSGLCFGMTICGFIIECMVHCM